jgi:hypothetical protein
MNRPLQAWSDDLPEGLDDRLISGGRHGDDITFGPGASNASWDQFATNEQKFGITTQFDENIYTTKLDRSAADFKERERRAQKLANEITGVSNPFSRLVFWHVLCTHYFTSPNAANL